MEATASAGEMRNTLVGFTVGAAFFCAIIGALIGQVAGGLAGALVGAFIGAGGVLLGWKPREQDRLTPIQHVDHPKYMTVWAVLFVLMLTKVIVAFLAFPKTVIIAILLVIAIWKALLVALFYMHLKFESRRMWVLAAAPLPLGVILIAAVLFEGWR
jgi:cytochrome c oxidase subunit IV